MLARDLELAALVLDLGEQAYVLDGDHRLGGEHLHELDLLVGEGLDGGSRQRDHPEQAGRHASSVRRASSARFRIRASSSGSYSGSPSASITRTVWRSQRYAADQGAAARRNRRCRFARLVTWVESDSPPSSDRRRPPAGRCSPSARGTGGLPFRAPSAAPARGRTSSGSSPSARSLTAVWFPATSRSSVKQAHVFQRDDPCDAKVSSSSICRAVKGPARACAVRCNPWPAVAQHGRCQHRAEAGSGVPAPCRRGTRLVGLQDVRHMDGATLQDGVPPDHGAVERIAAADWPRRSSHRARRSPAHRLPAGLSPRRRRRRSGGRPRRRRFSTGWASVGGLRDDAQHRRRWPSAAPASRAAR